MPFDGTLKDLFQQQPTSLLLDLTGGVPVKEFLNVELPSVQERRLDLVLLLADKTLLHIELQSANDADMGLRMLEYYTLLWRRYRMPVRQVVLYVGLPDMAMKASLTSDCLQFSFGLRDIREWNAQDLLKSSLPGDQILSVLGRTEDDNALVASVLKRIGSMPVNRRDRALRYILNLAALRKLEIIMAAEVRKMAIEYDWSGYPAVQEAREEGEARGIRTALLAILRKQFGPTPAWALKKIEQGSKEQLMQWLVGAADASKLSDLIPRR